MMSHTDYRTMIDRGRKAGLRATELYQAMSAERTQEMSQAMGQGDCNGYVPSCGKDGRRVFRPIGSYPRS